MKAAAHFCRPGRLINFEGPYKTALRSAPTETKGLSKGDVTSNA